MMMKVTGNGPRPSCNRRHGRSQGCFRHERRSANGMRTVHVILTHFCPVFSKQAGPAALRGGELSPCRIDSTIRGSSTAGIALATFREQRNPSRKGRVCESSLNEHDHAPHPRPSLQQLQAWTTNPSLLTHARSVEIVMRAAAAKYGGDPEVWAITGLLHDADYDQWPEDHPKRIVDWLREQGEEEIAYAVSFHQTAWDLPPKTMMDKCLLACDELTGFVIACCLVRPEGIATLEPKSVKKKLKDKAFAAKVDGRSSRSSVELLGVDMDSHIQFVIDALEAPCPGIGDWRQRIMNNRKGW